MSLPANPTPPLHVKPAPIPRGGSVKALWKRLGPWQGLSGPSAGCLLLAALASVAEVVAPALLGQLIDVLISVQQLPWGLFVVYGVALVTSVVFDRWGDLVEMAVAGRIMAQVHVRLLADRLLDPVDPEKERPAERASRLQQAAQAAGEIFRSGVAGPVRMIMAVVATVVMASLLSPSLGLASLVWSLLLLATTVLIAPETGRLSDQEQRARSEATSHAADAIGIRAQLHRLKATGSELERGRGLAHEIRSRLVARTRYAEVRLMIIGVLQAGFVLTVLAIGLVHWQDGTGSPGDVAAAVGLTLALMDNLQWAGQQLSAALAAKGTLAGVVAEWSTPRRRIFFPGPGIEEVSLKPADGQQPLRLREVSDGPLKRLNFEIEPGEHTGLVGPTDMRQALFALIAGDADPEEGTMAWGEVPWTPTNQPLQKDEVVRVAANPVLFDRSIADNLWLGETQRPLPANVQQLLAFVGQLRKGWTTVVGRQGLRLSQAQRQRLAVARALLDPPAWLVLEELPAGEAGERLLQDVLTALPAETTLLVGLRRPQRVDQLVSVVVLAHGQVVEDGSPLDLLTHGRHFARWFEKAGRAQESTEG